jgi:hypothetical protein
VVECQPRRYDVQYFTFNGTISARMLRSPGDTVELHLKNETSSAFLIDRPARVTGPEARGLHADNLSRRLPSPSRR